MPLPDSFRKRWENYVFAEDGIDRRFYELCVLAELKNALRSGDVSVSGSRQFRAFEEYLMPHTEFNERLASGSLHLAVCTSAATYLDARLSLLRQALDQTNSLAARGQLPDAELSSAGLKISPVDSNVPKEADALREDVYGLLPHVKITDLLLEVNRWTGFTRYFVHLKTGEPAKDPTLLLTAILADTRALPGVSGGQQPARSTGMTRFANPTRTPCGNTRRRTRSSSPIS